MESQKVDAFQYRPLAKDRCEIRLVRIVNVQEDPGKEVIMHLQVFSTPLDEAGPYIAVSYAWGDPTPTSKLVCNNAAKWVPENTFRTLYTIYHSTQRASTGLYRPGEQVTLWIDALCINQADVEEKNIQVPLMGRIYNQAIGAIGYIGAPAHGEDPHAGFHALAWFGNCPIIKPPEGIPADQSDPRFQEWFASYQASQATEPPKDFGRNLAALFTNDWFIMSWVVQEMVLSRKTVCLYGYGQHVVSWDLDTMAMMIDRGQSANNYQPGLHKAEKVNVKGIEKAIQVDSWRVLRSNLEKEPAGVNLVELLSRTRLGKATDLRDKVYSLLGMMKETDRAAIKVDYSACYTAAHVFLEVARHCMASVDGPNLLQHAGLEKSIPGLPSWVPDWSATYPTPMVTKLYNSCANLFRPIKILPESDGLKISALGVQVDVIATTGLPVSYPDGVIEISSGCSAWDRNGPSCFGMVFSAAVFCERLRQRQSRYPLKNEDWADVVWRTCCMDYKWSGSRLTVQDRRHFEACLQLNGLSDDLFESVRSNMSGSDPAALSSKRQDRELRGSALPK